MNWSDLEELSDLSLKRALILVYKFTGITMGVSKKTMLQGRLRPRVRDLGLSSYEQYFEYLNEHSDEVQEFVNLVTTNETYFFRTPRVWDFFCKEFLPRWSKENPNSILNIWSGAASTGEEIYTIGICCEEHRLKNPGFNYQIIGTDISSEVLKKARDGIYNGRPIELFKASNRPLFNKYMVPCDEGFQVVPEIRCRINFNIHNLFTTPFQSGFFDIVFLRNVLIYFEVKDQEKVLLNVGKALRAKGELIIGESESLSSLNCPFQFQMPLIYKKNGGGI